MGEGHLVATLLLLAVSLLGCRIVLKAVDGLLERSTATAKNIFSPLRRPLSLLLLGLAVCLSLHSFTCASGWMKFLNVIMSIAITGMIVRSVHATVIYMYRRADSKNYGAFLGFLPFFENVLNGLVIFLGGLVVAGQLGYKTSGVFAMFGLSGAVLAFAMKDVFANFVNALILVMDRPFRPGDHVKVGEIDAIVESIGIRSTRLRTLDDVLVVLPNAAIVNLPVYNIRSQKKWHIHEVLEFDSNTTSSSIAEWVRRSRDFLSHHDQIDPETIHVYFEHFSSRSLTLHLSCTTTAMNKTAYVDVRQALNLCLLDFCNQLSIRLVQTTH